MSTPDETEPATEDTALEADASEPSSSTNWSGRLGWLTANLVVVFVSVYAAFVLDRINDDQRDQKRVRSFEQALARDFATTSRSLTEQADSMSREFVDPFLQALDAGQRPALLPLPFAVGELDTGTWRALVTAGGIELLEPDTILEIDNFYDTLRAILGNLERFERLCDSYLIPALGAGEEEFYDSENRLLPRWQWYEKTLRPLDAQLEGLDRWAQSLAARFAGAASDQQDDAL